MLYLLNIIQVFINCMPRKITKKKIRTGNILHTHNINTKAHKLDVYSYHLYIFAVAQHRSFDKSST